MVLDDIFDQATRIGGWLHQAGFRGMFGIDFLVQGINVYPMEINPRFQGSTHILTQGELIDGRLPLVLFHILEFMDRDTSSLAKDLCFPEPHPIKGAQIVVYNKEDKECIVRGHLSPGVYRLVDGQLRFVRQGLSLFECMEQGEFVVTCAVPQIGRTVRSRSPLLKIQTFEQILNMNTNRLNAWASTIVQEVYRAMALE